MGEDDIDRLERLHGVIVEADVYASVALGLEQDGQWRERVSVILEPVAECVSQARREIEELIRNLYR